MTVRERRSDGRNFRAGRRGIFRGIQTSCV